MWISACLSAHCVHKHERKRGTIAVAILSRLPMACWHEPKQSGTNNTWRAAQRQLGSVVRPEPINELECGRGRGTGAAQANAIAWEPMHSDRSSPSPVLAWYKLILACAHMVPRQQHSTPEQRILFFCGKMKAVMAGQPLCRHSGRGRESTSLGG